MDEGDHPGVEPELRESERAQAEQRTAVRPIVVYEAIRQEGELELARPSTALAWSGLAAGLAMGFSLVAEGLLHAHLPRADWSRLISRLGYCAGFLMTILGRQQLFTENTLTVIIPLLAHRTRRALFNVARLWTVVLFSNLLGAFAFAFTIARTPLFDARAQAAFAEISREAVAGPPSTIVLKAIVSGWLIALMVWMLPAAESSRVFVIVVVTYLVGLADLAHVVAGSVEAFYAVAAGALAVNRCFAGYLLPTLVGNVIGGVALVSALNHAQVVSGAGEHR